MLKLKDYNYLEEDEINKENLIKDDGFILMPTISYIKEIIIQN